MMGWQYRSFFPLRFLYAVYQKYIHWIFPELQSFQLISTNWKEILKQCISPYLLFIYFMLKTTNEIFFFNKKKKGWELNDSRIEIFEHENYQGFDYVLYVCVCINPTKGLMIHYICIIYIIFIYFKYIF